MEMYSLVLPGVLVLLGVVEYSPSAHKEGGLGGGMGQEMV